MQFKFATALLVALLPSILALPEAKPKPEAFAKPEAKEETAIKLAEGGVSARDEPSSLVARACSYTTGCRSLAGAASGKYCGFCNQVRSTASAEVYATHIYQVNGGTGASSCCDYGYNSGCASRWAVPSVGWYEKCANNGRGW